MLKIYCIKDTKSGFMNPFYLQNDEIALRSFKKAANETQPNSVNDFPEDKELWYLGTFEEESGLITGELPRFLVRAIDCIIKRQDKE